jgi:plasmid stabilization system protein ParE
VDFRIRITKAALADFEEILEYSWNNFSASAERFGDAILEHVELLGRFPYIGSPVVDKPGVRRLVHTPIAIYYRVHDGCGLIEILHFWHGARRTAKL